MNSGYDFDKAAREIKFLRKEVHHHFVGKIMGMFIAFLGGFALGAFAF